MEYVTLPINQLANVQDVGNGLRVVHHLQRCEFDRMSSVKYSTDESATQLRKQMFHGYVSMAKPCYLHCFRRHVVLHGFLV